MNGIEEALDDALTALLLENDISVRWLCSVAASLGLSLSFSSSMTGTDSSLGIASASIWASEMRIADADDDDDMDTLQLALVSSKRGDSEDTVLVLEARGRIVLRARGGAAVLAVVATNGTVNSEAADSASADDESPGEAEVAGSDDAPAHHESSTATCSGSISISSSVIANALPEFGSLVIEEEVVRWPIEVESAADDLNATTWPTN